MNYQIIITYEASRDIENLNKENRNKISELEKSPNSGIKINNSSSIYNGDYIFIFLNCFAIYRINETKKEISILRVLSTYQDWENIFSKDNLKNYNVLIENNDLQIVRMNKSMCFDVYLNSLDEDNAKFVPDEVFNSLEEASGVIDHIISSYENKDGPFIYALIRKEDDINLGYVQLVKIEEGWEIGYHIAKKYTGDGYATRGVKLFLEYIKNNNNFKQIYGVALADNLASRRVLEKCGFKLIFDGEGIYQGTKRKIIKTIKYL